MKTLKALIGGVYGNHLQIREDDEDGPPSKLLESRD